MCASRKVLEKDIHYLAKNTKNLSKQFSSYFSK